MTRNRPRAGYAMMLVVVFLVLILSLSSVAFRNLGTALRIESARAVTQVRDEGSLQAAARGLAVLQTGLPPTDPYVAGVTIETSTGTRNFSVTFASEDETIWSVQAAPVVDVDALIPLPETFAAP
jgi:hypothetical protein